MISVRFQGKPFNITVIQVYAPTTNAKVTEVDQFHKNLQDLLELMPRKRSQKIFSSQKIGMQKVGSQEIPGVTGKFGLGVQSEAEKS